MASISVACVFGRWHVQFVTSNDVEDSDDEDTTVELDGGAAAVQVGVVSATLADDDRPWFGFAPSHPDQEPWWDEDCRGVR